MRSPRTTAHMISAITLSIVISSIAAGSYASQVPSAKELLDKYTQALDATSSYVDSHEFISEFSYNMPGWRPMLDARRFTRGQHRADGRRTYHQSYFWGDIRPGDTNVPESSREYHLRVEADQKLYVHSCSTRNPAGRVYFQASPNENAAFNREAYSGILGFLGADERLDGVLRRARRISVRPTTEPVNGSACYVIDAQTEYGKYALWLDPQHGYHAAKATREATTGQKDHDSVMPAGAHKSARFEIMRFELVDGVWVPMEGSQENAYSPGDPQYFNHERARFKRTKMAMNPDHKKLGSFDNPLENPAQDPELKNGTSLVIGLIPIKGVWENGKVVDSSGKAIDGRLLKTAGEVSILGKPLPALAGLCAELSQVQTEGKPVFVCFVDLQQRPCRQCLTTLAAKAGALEAQDIAIVVIQTAPANPQQQDVFLKTRRIAFPIHTIDGDLDVHRPTWGVGSLPWLVLADRNHIVRAEGFQLDEADAILARMTEMQK